MKNSYFEFKQFRVKQDKCSMKVGTDGVLLGAMVDCSGNPKQMLDIGTGTGLLALMMAQKFPNAKVTGIDVDENACLQAKENSLNSPWANRIEIIHTSLQAYRSAAQFDCILSNPPFYQNAIKSPNERRAQSRNEEYLPAKTIFEYARHYLSNSGELYLIYPIAFLQQLNHYAQQNNLFLRSCHYVRPNIMKAAHRVVLTYGKYPIHAITTKITCIEVLKRHDYSDAYKQMCQDFYLYF